MSNEDVINWLERYNETLRNRMKHLDKQMEDYESEKNDIKFNIQENNKLIRQLHNQSKACVITQIWHLGLYSPA